MPNPSQHSIPYSGVNHRKGKVGGEGKRCPVINRHTIDVIDARVREE